MTNAETILKLNEALTSLIKAYEELQRENETLKTKVDELEDEVLNLELVKEDLEKSVNELKNNTEEDKTTIYSMLGQIENILNKSATLDLKTTTSEKNIEQVDEIVKGEEVNKGAFNPVFSENILESSFGVDTKVEENKDLLEKKDEQTNDNNLLNSFSYDKNEDKKDDNKIDLSDGRLDSILGINQ